MNIYNFCKLLCPGGHNYFESQALSMSIVLRKLCLLLTEKIISIVSKYFKLLENIINNKFIL